MKKLLFTGLLCAILGMIVILPTIVQAATITVTSPSDSGPGSLREAISLANNGDEIRFDEALTGINISVTTGDILIEKSISIIGRGIEKTIISGSGIFEEEPGGGFSISKRIFRIDPSASVRIDGLTIKQGINQASTWGGGAIANLGDLFLIDSQLANNASPEFGVGGALYNGGRATLTRCKIVGNFARNAGAIANSGDMIIEDSVVQGNSVYHYVGGIGNGGSLRIIRSIIRDNGVSAGATGGIGNGGYLEVVESTIARNDGDYSGGGISNGGTAVVRNSTIQGNYGVDGGGILNYGQLTLDACTVTGNIAYWGGGIENEGTAAIKNSLLIGNIGALQCPDGGWSCGADCSGVFQSRGGNLVGSLERGPYDEGPKETVCHGFSGEAGLDLLDIDVRAVLEMDSGEWPWPEPLGDNGGMTPTVALIPGSPAIDRISSAECTNSEGNPLATDQRGTLRPQGSACDIGAFEFSQPRDTLFWMQQCREKNSAEYSSDQLSQFLAAVNEKSSAFPECAPASCAALEPDSPRSSWQSKAGRELLSVWLNLASGKLTKGRPIELVGLTSAATVGTAVAEIEAAICNPAATKQDLSHAKQIAQALNESSDHN